MPTYTGTNTSDVFVAPTAEDWSIFGLGGNDTLTGSGGNDTIAGGVGNDILKGGAGNDLFLVNPGAFEGFDSFDGGSGRDTIRATGDAARIGITSIAGIEAIDAGGFAEVKIKGGATGVVFDFTNVTLTDIVEIGGGAGNDRITGSAGDDFINGYGGQDILLGGGGDDTFLVGAGAGIRRFGLGDDFLLVNTKTSLNSYIGGAGFDTVQANADSTVIVLTTGSLSGVESITSGGFSDVTISGTAGVDVIDLRTVAIADSEITLIDGKDGNDTIYGTNINNIIGTTGTDTIAGGTGDDSIFGGSGDDIIDGGADFDYLDGGAGLDTVNGGLGDDTIVASGGDFLAGDEGNDIFLAKGGAANNFDGGADFDTIQAVANGNIAIESLTDVERIDGAGFTNVNLTGLVDGGVLDFTGVELIGIKSITGSGQADDFTGSAGNDVMLGNGGTDILNGGAGNDTISGGSALDVLTGGSGDDIFKDTFANLTGDTINDFGSGDKIQLSNLAFSAAVTLAFDTATNVLSIDPDGAGAKKAFGVTVLGGLTAANFVAVSDGASGTFIDYVASPALSSATASQLPAFYASENLAVAAHEYFM